MGDAGARGGEADVAAEREHIEEALAAGLGQHPWNRSAELRAAGVAAENERRLAIGAGPTAAFGPPQGGLGAGDGASAPGVEHRIAGPALIEARLGPAQAIAGECEIAGAGEELEEASELVRGEGFARPSTALRTNGLEGSHRRGLAKQVLHCKSIGVRLHAPTVIPASEPGPAFSLEIRQTPD